MIDLKNYNAIVLKAAVLAGEAIMKVYNLPDFNTEIKEDKSPLTAADLASNTIINSYLVKFPIPIISEENKQTGYHTRKTWDTCWMIDPLDGTKEFIKRNDEFTVNIALIQNGVPILGVIYVPVSRELYYGDALKGSAYKTIVKKDENIADSLFSNKNRIYPSVPNENRFRVVGSRSHMNQDTIDYIEKLKKKSNEISIVSKGSSLKFCLVAEGKAEVYPRFAPTMEWDTAAGHAICKAVGLKVLSNTTKKELTYNKEDLLNHHFIVQK